MHGHPWVLTPCYLALCSSDIRIRRTHLYHLLQHPVCMQSSSAYQAQRCQWCRWLKACSLTFCFRSSVVLPHDMSSLTLRMYLRARTVAAAEESIHERLEVVQNHASNLLSGSTAALPAMHPVCLLAHHVSMQQYEPLQCILPCQILHTTGEELKQSRSAPLKHLLLTRRCRMPHTARGACSPQP